MSGAWLREGVDVPIGDRTEDEVIDDAWQGLEDYYEALSAVKDKFPMMVCCDMFEVGGCTHGKPCECGGVQAPWPWIIHHPTASPFCECHLITRQDWMDPRMTASCWSSSKELVERITSIEASRWRPSA